MLQITQVLHATSAQVCMLEVFFNVVLHFHLHYTIKTTIVGIAAIGILFPFMPSIIVAYVISKNIIMQPCSHHFDAFAMFINSSFPSLPSLCLLVFLLRKNPLTTNVNLFHFKLPFTTCPS